MKKMQVLSLTIWVLLTLTAPVVAQTETAQVQLVSEYPAVQTAIQDVLNSQREALAKGTYRTLATGPSPVLGGVIQKPPVALILNRLQFEEGQQLQSSLYVLPGMWFGQVKMVRLMVSVDTNLTRMASSIISLVPGETIPVQNYIFDGSEPSGMYVYVVMIFDAYSGQLITHVGTSFVFRSFGQYDNSGHLRVDSAERQERFLFLKGNFVPSSFLPDKLQQFVVIGRGVFPITKSDQNTAIVNLGSEFALPPGIYDITLLTWHTDNTAYDSNTLPGALRVFSPRPNSCRGGC